MEGKAYFALRGANGSIQSDRKAAAGLEPPASLQTAGACVHIDIMESTLYTIISISHTHFAMIP
ncbi:hypothetical protein DI43_13605 [Geobacillus sp. CAMR12739]|nr:hypothetical protein DI43_13605 [Geobacillus sp. CAMR12739]OPX04773.1 hypothetical protein B1A75_00505 [Geobacillus sp. LEMMY01]